MLKEALKKVVEGIDLDSAEAAAAMEAIMNGEATDAQIGAFLVALGRIADIDKIFNCTKGLCG